MSQLGPLAARQSDLFLIQTSLDRPVRMRLVVTVFIVLSVSVLMAEVEGSKGCRNSASGNSASDSGSSSEESGEETTTVWL